MTDKLTALRLELLHHGYPPVPVTSPGATGVTSPGKAPNMSNWQNVCRNADEREITSWRFRYSDHGNTGILCGNVVAIDIDVLDDNLASYLEVHVATRLGETPLRRIGLWPKRLLVFRTDTPFHKLSTALFSYRGKPARVEILAEGEQFVAFGGHPSGREYTWTGDTPLQMALSDLPTVTAELCGAFLEECEIIMIGQDAVHAGARGQARPQAARAGAADRAPGGWCGKAGVRPPRDLVIDALRHIPNTDLDRDTWIALGFSLYAALGPDGGDVWEEWSAQYPGNVPANNAHAWASFANIRYSDHRKLFTWAEMRGWKGWPAEDREGRAEAPRAEAPPAGDTAERVIPAFAAWDTVAEDSIPARRWIIQRRLLRGEVSLVAAPGGTGKSLLDVLTALAVATGRELTGESIVDPCPAWIICNEDSTAEIQRRVLAAMRHFEIAAAAIRDRLFITGADGPPIVLFDLARDTPAATDAGGAIIRQAAAWGVGLVIMDSLTTLHRSPEADNVQLDAVMRGIIGIARCSDCAISLTHHTRKPGAGSKEGAGDMDTIRGASAIVGASRVASTAGVMSDTVAAQYGIEPEHRRRYLRLDDAKGNYAELDPAARWFRKLSLELTNGDSVGVLEPWIPPGALDGVTTYHLRQVQAAIEAAEPLECRADRRSSAWVGFLVAPIVGRDVGLEQDVAAINQMILTWIRNRVLVTRRVREPKQGRMVPIVRCGTPV